MTATPAGRIAQVARSVVRHMPIALVDAAAVAMTYLLAVTVRTGGRFDIPDAGGAVALAAAAGAAQVVANMAFQVYRRDWTVAGIEDLIAIAKATGAVVAALLAFDIVSEDHYLPFGAVLSGGAMVLVVQGALRLRPRWAYLARAALGRSRDAPTAIVVGAGMTGQLLVRSLGTGSRGPRVACFVDEDPRRRCTLVRGIPVAGGIDELPALIAKHGASLVVIAASAPPGELARQVVELCEGSDVRVRAVSGLGLTERDTSPLRAIGIDELLARGPVDLDTPEARTFIQGRRALVTGAAGSIGSELVRRIVALDPERVVLLDANENALHDLSLELRHAPVEILLGDVRDRAWLAAAMGRVRPDVLFHAAAYKHVPIVEEHPLPGIATNVLGTATVLATAVDAGVAHVVTISSDKAVEPVNVLGLTKRFAELLTVATGRELGLRYCVVRFGNVLGSSGSVVPIFARQIDQGGPITLTDADATRYFMTIPEAAGLVVQAAAIAEGGDLLVLDMGSPVPILDLARKMVRLRGLRAADVPIAFTGLRPGERLHEQLFFADEDVRPTAHAQVLRATGTWDPSLADLQSAVQRVAARLSEQDGAGAIEIVRSAIGPLVPSRP